MNDLAFPPPIDNARPSIVLERMTEAPEMKGSVVSRLRQPIKVETFVNGEKVAGRGAPEILLAPTISPEPIPQPDVRTPPVESVPTPIPVATPAPVTRTKVVLRGSTKGSRVGRMTLFCSAVAVSDSLVVLKYPLDGQTTVVEPPTCMADDPLLVDYQGSTYKCMSDNWAIELDGAYLVVLLRLPDAE